MQRRGLSDVVTTVLIILISLAAVVLLWNFLQPILSNATNLGTEQFTTKLSVPEDSLVLDPSNQQLSLNIERGAGEGNIAGFIFGLKDPSGNVKTFRQNVSIDQLELRNFVVNYSQYNFDDVVSVSITPIFKNNQTGKEVVGQPINQPVKKKIAYQLPSGLVAHWKFEDNYLDSSPNGLHADRFGNVTLDSNTKKVGSYSALLPGSASSYIQIPDNAVFNDDSFTIVAWVYPRSLNNGNFLEIVDKTSAGSGYRLRYNRANAVWEFYVNSNRLYGSSLSGNGNLNSWEFLAASYGNSVTSIYYNSDVNTTNSFTISPSNNILQIGDSFNGNLDEIMFFNRVLTAQEISDIRVKYR